jgi:RHS repeat-associated protein
MASDFPLSRYFRFGSALRAIVQHCFVAALVPLVLAVAHPAAAQGWQGKLVNGVPTFYSSMEASCLSFESGATVLDYIEVINAGLAMCRMAPQAQNSTVLLCSGGDEVDSDGTLDGCAPMDWCPDCMPKGDNEDPADHRTGNPISLAYGNKQEVVVDFATPGPNSLSFVRIYNSMLIANSMQFSLPLGMKWMSNYDRLLENVSGTVKKAHRPNGSLIVFTLVSGVWTPPADQPAKLAAISGGWQFTDYDDTVETYNSSYKLTTIKKRNGYQQDLTYDGNGKLSTVTDSYGRTLTFTVTGSRLTQMVAPDGGIYQYSYDKAQSAYISAANRLIQVTYPRKDAVQSSPVPTVIYHYENSAYPGRLTGITDQKGVRYATWGYNGDGRANASEHAGSVDDVAITYGSSTRTVTEPLGQQTIYTYSSVLSRNKLTSIARQASSNVPAATKSYTYGSNGFMLSRTDFNGNVTNYVHDSRGLQTSRTEADGTAQERTITTTWHSTFRMPTQVVVSGVITDFTYDSSGRVLTRTEEDTTTHTVPYSTNGTTRTWTYTWDSTGLLQTVNGPRTDVTDITTYAWTNGLLTSVTSALSQVTQITAHDPRGLPTSITDPNGVVTELSYNQRAWLASVTVESAAGDATTRFEYDEVGQITAIVRPDGSRLEYEYDNARRLTAVENSLGERIEYTLDAMGNRTAENIRAVGSPGSIVKSMTSTYDTLGRLLSNIGASSQTTSYEYDDNSNVTEITDPLSGATVQAFDALDRLIQSTDPLSGDTDYAYDNRDNLTGVTDPRTIQTTYVYDGFGHVIQTASPDAGTTVYENDLAGNRTEMTDARSIVTQYSYDALNRMTAKTFPGNTSENVSYSYDDTTSGKFRIGRLTAITDESGSTTFTYDNRGNVVEESRVVGGLTYVTKYTYDTADNLVQMAYPSGRLVNYARDTLGRVISVTTQASSTGTPFTVVSDIEYKPFGPIASLTYGSGLTRTLSYDSDYRLTSLATEDADTDVQGLTYGYDDASNITSIDDALATSPSRDQTFTYDDLYRLTQAVGAYGTIDYDYDAVGNRTVLTQGSTTENYSYASTSNRLDSVTVGSNTRNFTYDNAGNVTVDAEPGTSNGLAYNHANRLKQAGLNGTPTHDYVYNALGQRVVKSPVATPTNATHFHYDGSGKLIAETGTSGSIVREYVYLAGMPIGQFVPGSAGSPSEVTIDNSDGGASGTSGWVTGTAGSGYLGSNYHELLPGDTPSGGTTIDNSDSAFKTLGIWSTQTTPSGFEGSNYRRRQLSDGNGSDVIIDDGDAGFSTSGTWTAASASFRLNNDVLRHVTNELSTGAIILDNTDGAVTYTGTWATSTFVTNYYGTNYRQMPANTPVSGDVVNDNDAAGSSSTGTWTSVNYAPAYGGTYRSNAAGTGADIYTWTPTLPSAKTYKVYARWRDVSGNATNAPYTIYHDGGSTTVTVSQTNNSTTWILLGSFAMTPGQNHRVELSDNANGTVIADAVTFHDAAAPGNVATYTPTLSETGAYRIYVRTPANVAFATDAPYTVVHDGGSSTVTVNQTADGGVWKLLGTYTMTPGQSRRVEISDRATTGTVIADAVTFEWTGLTPPTAAWTPSLARRDLYDVQAWWPSSNFLAPEANYKITGEAGSTTVTVDQQINYGQWNTLSPGVILDVGIGHKLELPGKASGNYVYADGARFLPSPNLARSVSWTFTPSGTGTHLVYAKWPAAATHTTEAKFTIAHAGGTTDVTVNQKSQGGQWLLLGSFTMNASTAYAIALSDNPNGQVAADAVRVVPQAASSEKFTWTPTIPSSGSYDVYARWVASSANTGAATYTVTHSGGSSNVVVNQKQNGGAWVRLGTYSFAPSSGHKVELLGANDGRVVADGIRLVSASAQAANIAYIHTDHLGSPQKITDTAQALTWDAQFEPFGEEFSITGSATQPNRFPGQYADTETGYSYNYFRDYDPTIGRYVQSDPIGLRGGLNTYQYAMNSPVDSLDPFGLECVGDGTNMTCNPPGADTAPFTIPQMPGFPDYVGPEEDWHHVYRADASTRDHNGSLGPDITDEIIKNPTPGDDQPATPEGTLNDAGISPVTGSWGDSVRSYITTATDGSTVVVNVTVPGQHMLDPGYVAQYTLPGPTCTKVVVVGEGNAGLSVPTTGAAEVVFGDKVESDIRKAIVKNTKRTRREREA